MVDIHSHILPAVDDGSKSWDMTLEMCHIALEDGVTHMVATPHANDEFKYDREAHLARVDELRQKIGGKMEFSLGCDFHMSYDNVQAAMADPTKFTIGNTRYLLVEFSDYGITPHVRNILEDFLAIDVVPIITHPERNSILQRNPQVMFPWIESGVLVQVTANSVTGFWGSHPKKVSEFLLKEGAVHVLASDAHEPRKRTPILSKARAAAAAIVGQDYAEMLVSANPLAIVKGEPLPYMG